jgi:pimeloyl-ACP methyl ester carboxylesterase
MPNVTVGHIRIEYDALGDRSSPPLLLIMGLGGQMIDWDDRFCSDLAERGHYVIRFDNRDIGLSSKLEAAGTPDIMEVVGALMQGKEIQPSYRLEDMADDAAGLLTAIGVEKAHICGASMGGMIAQTLAIRHPKRVSSLISIYSTTGNPELPQPKPEVMEFLIAPPPEERDAYIEYTVRLFRTISGRGFPFDEEWTRELAARRYDRSFYPQGIARQLAAVLAQENRKPDLASVAAPTLVIHGADDPLVPVEGGRDTAEAVPGAELMIIEGMGHDLPHGGAWPRIADAIAEHTRRAGP